jgi:hypothetical protein
MEKCIVGVYESCVVVLARLWISGVSVEID